MLFIVIPAKAGIQRRKKWIHVFTGNPGFRIKCGMTRLVTLQQATGGIESKKRIKEFYEVNNMPEVVGVRFKSCGRIYDFEVNGIDVSKGDLVVAESEFGLTIGNVIAERHTVEAPERELKKVIRKATEEDLQQSQENIKLAAEAKDYCLERIMARGLTMKPVATEATLDKKRIIIYFTAEKRIDFRELVKDLAARFKTRIEMRQIGVRDEAKTLGGMGICGRELCCTKFLTFFEPISIKMAKRQELILNTGKLSGLCGRLMCCLGYEYDEESPEDVALTEEDSPLPEDAEEFEIIVASDEPSGKADELMSQPLVIESQRPLQPKEQEHRESFRKSKGRRRKRRKMPHKK